MASALGATNTIPFFVQQNGPAIEARFVKNSNDKPDGGVHNLFTIIGRSDAPAGCTIQQESFSNPGNLALRITTPTFGLGLIEAITDTTLKNNVAANATQKQQLGITGQLNTSGNDGTVTRFGWKAQNKSILMFAGEAYNVEMGISSELFPQNREENPNCLQKGSPEDFFNFETNTMSHIQSFATFMKFLDQPAPSCGASPLPACSASVQNGQQLFTSVGCANCHTPSLQTGTSTTAALSNIAVNLYSDLALHDMGPGLSDGVNQGLAGPGEWRTAPLWGLGQRVFFLHDGRTTDLNMAIMAHTGATDSSVPQPTSGKFVSGGVPGSEAQKVTNQYKALSVSAKQDLLNFLRSL